MEPLNLFNLIVVDSCKLSDIKSRYIETLESKYDVAIVSFLQFLIDLSQHDYQIQDCEFQENDDTERICEKIIRNAKAAYCFPDEHYLLNLSTPIIDNIALFIRKICTYDFLSTRDGGLWLEHVWHLCSQMILSKEQSWYLLGGTLSLMLWKALSVVQEKLNNNPSEALQNLLEGFLPAIFHNKFNRIFMFKLSAKWCVPAFCGIVEQHPLLYATDTSIVQYYSNILCFKFKQSIKTVLQSLKFLLDNTNEAVRSNISDFILTDLTFPMKNILRDAKNVDLKKSCFELINKVLALDGYKPSVDESVHKDLQLLILDKNRDVRVLAGQYLALTNDKKTFLEFLLKLFTEKDISSAEITQTLLDIWDLERFSQWNIYWKFFKEISERSHLKVLAEIIVVVLKKLGEIFSREEETGVLDALLDFYHDYYTYIKKYTKKTEKLNYLLDISSVIHVQLFKVEYSEESLPLQLTLTQLQKTLDKTHDYELIYKILTFYLSFSKICKCENVNERLEENCYDKLSLPNYFNKFLTGLENLINGYESSPEFEQSLLIISCYFEITSSSVSDFNPGLFPYENLEVLFFENHASKIKNLGAYYVLCYLFLTIHYKKVQLTVDERALAIIKKMHFSMKYLNEYLTSALENGSKNRAKLFEELRVIQVLCEQLSFLVQLRSYTQHLPPQSFIAYFSLLAKNIEAAAFTHGVANVIKSWIFLVKHTTNSFPKQKFTAHLLTRWIREDKFEDEFQELLLELVKNPDNFNFVIATATLDLRNDQGSLEIFLKKIIKFLKEVTHDGNDLPRSVANLLNEMINLVKTDPDLNNSTSGFPTVGALNELTKIIQQDAEAVKAICENLEGTHPFIRELNETFAPNNNKNRRSRRNN